MKRESDGDFENLLKQLILKTNSLENKLDTLLKQQSINSHISIHHVDIHQPVLKELSFSLDALDIKELSGSLNIGNNFGSELSRKSKQKDFHQNNTQNDLYSDICLKINDKKIPFSIHVVENKKRGEI